MSKIISPDTFFFNSFVDRRTYSYSEPQLYNQNSAGNYFDTQGSSAQVSTVVTTHSMSNNGNGNGALAMGLSGGQIISSSGAYLIGGNSMDGSTPHTAAQSTRASPATVSQSHPIQSDRIETRKRTAYHVFS